MPDSSLPPPDFNDGSADDHKDRPSAFDDFVNKDLDMSGLDSAAPDKGDRASSDPVDRSFLRPLNPFPFPTQKPSEDSLFGSLPNQRTQPSSDDDIPPRFGSRLLGTLPPSTPIPRVSPPPPEDPRWVRGVYRVQRDLRIYKNPHRAAQKVCTLPEANRRIDKSLRFIANVSPGWSAVHLYGEQPIIGFVDNSEVVLVARRGLRDVWEDVALIVCLLLLILALVANLDQLPFFNGGDQSRITELEQTVTEQQTRITELEATLESLRDRAESRSSSSDGR
ncbi:MAG: hypothetical protein U0670_11180 [Anaerolineae bacterium]